MKSTKYKLLVNQFQPRLKTLIGLLVCLVVIGVTSALFLNYSSRTSLGTNPGIGTLITAETATRDINVVVYSDYIYLEPFEQNSQLSSFEGMTILSTNYPELFNTGDSGQNFISVTTIIKSGAEYVQISNNQPDHGGYSSTYSLYLDVKTGQITETLEEPRR